MSKILQAWICTSIVIFSEGQFLNVGFDVIGIKTKQYSYDVELIYPFFVIKSFIILSLGRKESLKVLWRDSPPHNVL